MWLFTTIGFFSVVQDRDDATRVLVRARVREDLERLAERLPGLEIAESPGADYRFRTFAGRDAFARAAAELAGEIDYPNFKSAVAARQGAARERVYLRVWEDVLALQEGERP